MVQARGLAVNDQRVSSNPPVGPASKESYPVVEQPLFQRPLSPADKVVIAYLAVLAALVALSHHRINYWWAILLAHAAVILIIVAISRCAVAGASLWRFIHGWYPVALVPVTFKELTFLIPLIHPRDYDWELARIDYWMFGAHPTVWLERFTWPVLTEFFQLSYTTYYFLPLILGAVLWSKRWFERFNFFVFVAVLGFYLSYLGYIAVPAIGPRFILASEQSFPLRGVFLYQWIRDTLDRAEGITRDAFPSGHTELTLLVLYYAGRFHRRTFWLMLPAGSALIISTVYLRYHYVIDVIAGGLLALLVIAIAPPLYRALGGAVDAGRAKNLSI
ncbi:MAG TPA: phosphatase PAP2 family protein [Blastocatellia bacterium]|nr:phosphatase PAP2 family protein [Blastocatellia bacterium]